MNSAARVTCFNCGWRLKPDSTTPLPPGPDPDCTALRAENLQLKQQNAQLQAEHEQLASDHQELDGQHKQLSSDHQELAQQHQGTVVDLATTQQELAHKETLRQKAADLLAEAKAEIERLRGLKPGQAADAQATIAKLNQSLAEAGTAYAKLNAEYVAIQKTPIWPLWQKVLSWAIAAIVGLGGGATAGIYSPLNPFKKEVKTTLNGVATVTGTLTTTETQLAKAKQDLVKATQDQTTSQQSITQLTAQVDSLTKGTQSTSKQLAAVQAQLTASKAETAKEHATAAQVQQEVQTEKARNQQLSDKAARVTALESVIAAHPSLNYKGATQGTITIHFNGRSDKPASIVMNQLNTSPDSNVKIESVIGTQLPGVPVIVEPMTKNVSIAAPPSAANKWGGMMVIVQGKGSSQAVLKWTIVN
jgi:myosin heavy subunit